MTAEVPVLGGGLTRNQFRRLVEASGGGVGGTSPTTPTQALTIIDPSTAVFPFGGQRIVRGGGGTGTTYGAFTFYGAGLNGLTLMLKSAPAYMATVPFDPSAFTISVPVVNVENKAGNVAGGFQYQVQFIGSADAAVAVVARNSDGLEAFVQIIEHTFI